MVRHIILANRIMLALCGLFALTWAASFLLSKSTVEWEGESGTIQPLPKGAFTQSNEAYEAINGPAFSLNFNPPSEQLPDLRKQLIYYGKDWRPDAAEEQQQMYFAARGLGRAPEIKGVKPGEKVYLSFEQKKGRGVYLLSSTPSSFWFEPGVLNEEAEIKVFVQRPSGEFVTTPSEHHTFTLEEREAPRFGGGDWKIGEHRVDNSLLIRQKVRWYGPDLFLQMHGGEEYEQAAIKQRLEVGKGDITSSFLIAEGDYFVWKEEEWQEATLGEETRSHNLLWVKKIEERRITFVIWGVGGRQKRTVNLVKMNEPWRFSKNQKIRFVGARTRSHSILEFEGKRIIVGPDEWLLRQEERWIKLDTVELIDDYVEGRLRGELFVCEGVRKNETGQVFSAHLFSPARSSVEHIEFSMQGGEPSLVDPQKKGEEEEDLERELERGMPDKRGLSSIIQRSSMIRQELQRGEGGA